ncbi:MAG: hypothetical protein JJT96_06345 [Opitutales bacterium]|nr:hypothetical protein [Opitutales bacterium]
MSNRFPILAPARLLLTLILSTSFAFGQSVDLRPYFNFLLKDGFTLIFEGEAEDTMEEGEFIDARWVYQTIVRSEAGGVTETILRTSNTVRTPEGNVAFTIDGNLRIDSGGVTDAGTNGYSFLMGEFVTIGVDFDENPLFLPASATVGQTFTSTFNRTTRTAFSGDDFMETTTEIKREITVIGIESVTVPAGTFEALVIEQLERQETPLFGSITMTNVERTRQWLAEDVGFVKVEVYESGEISNVETEEERLTSSFQLVEFHESYQPGPVDAVFSGAGSLIDGESEFFFQPWFGFFLGVSEDSPWIYHPGFGFVYSLGGAGPDGRWFFSPDPRIGTFYIDNHCVSYTFVDDLETDEVSAFLTGWFFTTVDDGTWFYFEADIFGATLTFWPNGQAPATTIQFAPILSEEDF